MLQKDHQMGYHQLANLIIVVLVREHHRQATDYQLDYSCFVLDLPHLSLTFTKRSEH